MSIRIFVKPQALRANEKLVERTIAAKRDPYELGEKLLPPLMVESKLIQHETTLNEGYRMTIYDGAGKIVAYVVYDPLKTGGQASAWVEIEAGCKVVTSTDPEHIAWTPEP